MPARSPGRSSCATSLTAAATGKVGYSASPSGEAWRLDEVAKRTIPYDPQEEPQEGVLSVHQVASPGDPQWQRVELNAVTEILATLPPRVRQVALLRATGTGYKEISELTGNSLTTVHKLVRRANESVGEAVRDASQEDRSKSPRVQRLESLERKPPPWLVAAIGRAPGRTASTSRGLAWRRAALAIDDYRRLADFRGRTLSLSASGRATRRRHAPTRQPLER